ncbi:F-box/kelch-repeat protein At3g23880-like [Impatiens glandulifera]|uniref:F-box/kelch-repeat protein At3g23880-like n=1 Tax=Impatiens glandulifera TaxID=253017 RepID=UPI001FB13DB3|nr:F-box/kelch-repeat protein At3g23880-like [Impatiens glandulifera]
MYIKSDRTAKRKKKRRKTVADCDSVHVLPYLPTEIITKILIRLPVKTLVRFKCVCRSWLALISDPIFVENHLRASIQDKGYAHHRLIMSSGSRSFEVKSCSLSSVLHEECPSAHDHYYPLKHPQRFVSIVGSVNGLVCIAIDQGSVFLWNPSTRKSKRLPNCGFKKRSRGHIVYGFGYDEASSDYKVIVAKSELYGEAPFKTEVKIYGYKSDSWRRIENFPEGIPMDAPGTFVGGSLHWPASGEIEFNYSWSIQKPIVSFDLSKETYSAFSQPCYGKGASNPKLGVLCDNLCLLCNIGYKRADVWVMKEYGKVESWSKLFSIPYSSPLENFPYSVPLCISFRKNEVLLVVGSRLVLYNMDNHTVRLTNIQDCIQEYHLKAYTYIDSLVSPYPE